MDAVAAEFVATLDAASSAELDTYLGGLVASEASDDELQELWSDGGAEWSVAPIRPFFERIRAQLAAGGEQ
jgi:hypothetical protein